MSSFVLIDEPVEFSRAKLNFIDPTIEYKNFCYLDAEQLKKFLKDSVNMSANEMGLFRRLWSEAQGIFLYFSSNAEQVQSAV